MPSTFPETLLNNSDLPDVEVLNRVTLPIAQKLSGRLNEHDIDATTPFTYTNLASSCYYTCHQVMKSVDPSLTVNNWFLQTGAGPDSTYTFSDGFGWERVRDMVTTLTTGEDVLWIIGMAQHAAWLGLAGTNPAQVPSIATAMRLQYALQVDSQVIDETITGAAILPDYPPQQLYRVEETATDFDWRHIQDVEGTIGVNNFAHPTRMMAVVPVSPGSHTLEMLARRVPNLRGKVDEDGAGVYAQVFSRRLFAVRIKGSSAQTGSASSLDVAAWQDGDVVSATTLGGRLTRLKNKINDLEDGDLERGALNHEHIPTTIHYPKATSINGADQAITSVYTGYGGALGWTVLNDGAGVNLRTSGAMDFRTLTGVLVVLANVEVKALRDTVTPTNLRAVGVLALRIHNSAGTNTVIAETEVYVNAHNPDPVTSTMANIHDDLPLMWVVDVATLSVANQQMDYIEVVGATWDGSGAANAVTMTTKRGTITSWLFRGATLS